MILSSQHSSFLIVLELLKTQGYDQPDTFSRLFCYPVRSGFYDLAISDVTREENVIGRYEVLGLSSSIQIIVSLASFKGMLTEELRQDSRNWCSTAVDIHSFDRNVVQLVNLL